MLMAFLNEHRARTGEQSTHTSLGAPVGKFCVLPSDVAKLHSLYRTCLRQGAPLHLTEVHLVGTGPVLIDLDFRQRTAERVYTPELIRDFIGRLCTLIARYTDRQTMTAYVLEKPTPRPCPKHPNVYKDGVHVVLPDVVTKYALQHFVRKRFIEDHGEMFSSIAHFTNAIQDIYDEAVIDRNNWFMYGSRKTDESHPWKVTASYTVDVAGDRVSIEPSEHWKEGDDVLLDVLSIREHLPPEVAYSEAYEVEHGAASSRGTRSIVSHSTSSQQTISAQSFASIPTNAGRNQDYAQAVVLVPLLGDARADAWREWMSVGWCLHNIEPSERMCALWTEFSRRSPKYESGECAKLGAHDTATRLRHASPAPLGRAGWWLGRVPSCPGWHVLHRGIGRDH